jgi:signal transduction histidine kinase
VRGILEEYSEITVYELGKGKTINALRYQLFSLALFCLLCSTQSLAQRVIVLTDSGDSYAIGVFSDVLRDSRHDLTVDSVAFGSASNRFIPSNSEENNFGHTRDVIWIRFTVRDEAARNSDWLIAEDYSMLDKAVLYIPTKEHQFMRLKSGTIYPMKERAIRDRLIVFPIELNNAEQKTCFLQLESQFSLPVNLKIWKPVPFAYTEGNKSLLFGIFFGALLIMAFYNLSLFFSVRDLSYLYYFLYAVSVGFYQSWMVGLSPQFLTPNITWINLHLGLASIGFAALFGIFFVREFLEIPRYSARLDAFYKLMIGAGVVYVAILAPALPRMAAIGSAPMWMGSITVNVISGVYCLRKGNKNAQIYMVATLIFLVGAVLRTSRILGVEQESFFTEWGMLLGLLAEMTILSIALGNKINAIKAEKEREKGILRNRISTDLHDEIGSNLSSIVVATEMIKRRPMDHYAMQRLTEISQTAMKTADTMRDIVWFINPENDKLDNLILKMKDVAVSLFRSIQYEFRSPEKISNNLSPEERRNIFLIYKEVLNNIVKHAGATRVEIEVKEDRRSFLLSIQDNGKGFDKESVKKGEGLKNLQRRAKVVGGILDVRSECGPGTRVELTLDLNVQEKKPSLA